MRKLYKFHDDWGRQGDLDGLFIADDTDVKDLIGKTIYFGEVLGKHSNVDCEITPELLTEIDVPEDTLAMLEKELGVTWSGLNPFEYVEEEE